MTLYSAEDEAERKDAVRLEAIHTAVKRFMVDQLGQLGEHSPDENEEVLGPEPDIDYMDDDEDLDAEDDE
ncbi:MAG: hypothetical protein JWO38_6280 [Gemmataceae bacterium]|nr:hypothetical protein [Gemmataceae bacterium]